jgi:hypothetical protein
MVARVEVVDLLGQATGLTLGAASAAAVIGVRYALSLRSFG